MTNSHFQLWYGRLYVYGQLESARPPDASVYAWITMLNTRNCSTYCAYEMRPRNTPTGRANARASDSRSALRPQTTAA